MADSLNYKNGQVSIILRVFIPDSTSVVGGGKTGLTFSSSGLIISTIADNEATPTNYTQAGSTIETITTLGTFAAPTATKCRFKEIDSANQPGAYEIQIANARWAVSSATYVDVYIPPVSGLGTGMYKTRVRLTAVDPQDATAFGVSRIDAAISSRMATFTVPTNFGSLSIDSSGRVIVITNQDKTGYGLADGAITAAKIATDAIGAAQIAADAITEIQTGLATASALATAQTAITDIQTDVDEVQSAALTQANVRSAVGLASANLDTQLNTLQSTLTDVQTDVDEVQTAALTQTNIRSAIGLAAANLDTQLGLIASYIDTEVSAIKAKTDNLPSDPSSESSIETILATLATSSGLSAVSALVTAIKAITDKIGFTGSNPYYVNSQLKGADTDTINAAALAANAVTEIQAGLATASALASLQTHGDSTWATADISTLLTTVAFNVLANKFNFTGTEVDANTKQINSSSIAAARLALSAAAIISGALTGSPTTTSLPTNLTETNDNQYLGRIIIFTSGLLLGQVMDITAYNGTSKTLTVNTLTDAPTVGDTFLVI